MTGWIAKYWIIPRLGDKELPRVGHQLASCSLLISYVLMFLSMIIPKKLNTVYCPVHAEILFCTGKSR